MIEKLLSIEGLGIYSGKDSFTSNIDMKKFNVIYGYNGAGKTSLSRAFRYLEKKDVPECLKEENPDIKFSLMHDGVKVQAAKGNIGTINVPIKVFNSDFVWENIHWSKNGSKGIVTVSQEQQGIAAKLAKKRLEKDSLHIQIKGGINKDAAGQDQKVVGKEKELELAEGACEKLLTDCAVKQVRNSGWTIDKNFNRPKFEPYMTKAAQNEIVELNEADIKRLQKEAMAQQQLDEIKLLNLFSTPDEVDGLFSSLIKNVSTAASREAIPSLKDSPELEAWLKEGFRLHVHVNEECPVCTNIVTEERIKELRAHFSTEAEELEEKLDAQKEIILQWQNLLAVAPIKEQVYEAYYDQILWSAFQEAQEKVKNLFCNCLLLIDTKINKIDSSLEAGFSVSDVTKDFIEFSEIMTSVNSQIAQHNQFSTQQEVIRKSAVDRLIQNVAVTNLAEYQTLMQTVEAIKGELTPLIKRYEEIPTEIENLESQLTEVGKSSVRINEYLKAYLGHDRLELSVDDGGYSILRNKKKSAAPLSEGEKTALAFCYFIASLQKDASCDLKNTILVIDDPVSSLDSRHLHYVFSFMKKMTLEAKQIFVLTHNFNFYKICQKSLPTDAAKKSDDFRLLSIQLIIKDDSFISSLQLLPKSLEINESEYQYFSSKLFEAKANDNAWDNADLYGLANACRRVLECFFSFKLPKPGQLDSKFEELIIALEAKHKGAAQMPLIIASARERFVQIGSHGDNLDKLLGLDNVSLDTVKDAVAFTLDFIEYADAVHFKALKSASKTA